MLSMRPRNSRSMDLLGHCLNVISSAIALSSSDNNMASAQVWMLIPHIRDLESNHPYPWKLIWRTVLCDTEIGAVILVQALIMKGSATAALGLFLVSSQSALADESIEAGVQEAPDLVANNTLSVLFIASFLGLSVLTIGVCYFHLLEDISSLNSFNICSQKLKEISCRFWQFRLIKAIGFQGISRFQAEGVEFSL